MERHRAYRKPTYVRKVGTSTGVIERWSDLVTVSQNTFRTVHCDTPSVTDELQGHWNVRNRKDPEIWDSAVLKVVFRDVTQRWPVTYWHFGWAVFVILMRSLMICTSHPICSGDKIEKEVSGACSAWGREERRIQDFGGETWRKETTWETQA